tara:strand:+ start:5747 stop:6181 length:435 start_codon:yes stop_codon:yes gene_type:complete
MEKYLYFRNVADGVDDDDAAVSGLFSWSSFKGMHPTSDTAITLWFEPTIRVHGEGAAATGNWTNNDSVIINITQGRAKEVMAAIIAAMTEPQIANSESFITIADDMTTTYLTSSAGADETVTAVTLNKWITDCGTITIGAAFAD